VWPSLGQSGEGLQLSTTVLQFQRLQIEEIEGPAKERRPIQSESSRSHFSLRKLNFHYQDFISFDRHFVPIRADANLPFSFDMIILLAAALAAC